MTWRHFLIALQFLTRLPTPRVAVSAADDLSRASAFFPVVGLLIGVAIAGAQMGGGFISAAIGGLAGLLAWVAITGGLHLDGLGDVTDALGASHSKPERFIEVLGDPNAGNFAVIAISLQLATNLVLLASLPVTATVVAALILIPAWARWAAVCWGWRLPSLNPGLGRDFSALLSPAMIAAWGVALVAMSIWLAPVTIVALPVALLIGLYWRRRLGGITGDCLGAGIEVMESVLLLALLAATVAR